MSKPKSGISRVLAKMTVLPLLVFGIVTTIFSSFWVSSSMEDEVQNELKCLAQNAVITLDMLYPGDYYKFENETELLITKGDTILNSNYSLIDSLQQNNGIDYTLFYGDLRIITTLRTEDELRLIGTPANPQIVSDVIDTGAEAFYTKVDIYGTNYFCYYEPLFNSDGSCVGMFAAVMPEKWVRTLTMKAVLPILALSVVAILLAALWSLRYSAEFIAVLQKLTSSFEKVSKGTLSNTVPPDLLARKDEFGSMAHSMVDMQASLRGLVEQDMLTGVNNRRFGQQKLSDLIEKTAGTNMGFSIALGDIDFFKKFNDTYGHDCGDYVLKSISALMKDHVKDYGYCIRWGGEEFLIVLTQGSYMDHVKVMTSMIEKIRRTEYSYDSQTLSVTMTFGLIDAASYGSSDEMLKVVDTLLYYGKQIGRNRLITINEMPEEVLF